MICSSCKKDKKGYDFVLPPNNLETNQICRKCYHLSKEINDDDYESFITIHYHCRHLVESTTELIERTEDDIKNDNLEKYSTGVSPEEFLEYLYHFMDMYHEIMRCAEKKIEHIELWAKLVKEYKYNF